jgi:hypothetical protein
VVAASWEREGEERWRRESDGVKMAYRWGRGTCARVRAVCPVDPNAIQTWTIFRAKMGQTRTNYPFG